MGVATSGSILFRQVGGSVGIAIFGAIFINRLHVNLAKALPAGTHGPSTPTPAIIDKLPPDAAREVRRRVRRVASSGVRRRRRDLRGVVRAHVAPPRGAAAQDDAAARGGAGRAHRSGGGRLTGELDLLDWRRRVFDLYAEVRATDGPEQAWRRWRAVRDDLFRDHPQSPSPGYTGLDYFPYDPALRLLAEVEPAEEELREIAGSAGSLTTFRCFGRAPLPFGTLELYWLEGYGGGVFLPFADRTSGRETYGGGRYLLDTVKGSDLGAEDGAGSSSTSTSPTTPPARTTARWACPLSPPGEPARRRAPGRGKGPAGPQRLILLLRCGHGWHKAVP